MRLPCLFVFLQGYFQVDDVVCDSAQLWSSVYLPGGQRLRANGVWSTSNDSFSHGVEKVREYFKCIQTSMLTQNVTRIYWSCNFLLGLQIFL